MSDTQGDRPVDDTTPAEPAGSPVPDSQEPSQHPAAPAAGSDRPAPQLPPTPPIPASWQQNPPQYATQHPGHPAPQPPAASQAYPAHNPFPTPPRHDQASPSVQPTYGQAQHGSYAGQPPQGGHAQHGGTQPHQLGTPSPQAGQAGAAFGLGADTAATVPLGDRGSAQPPREKKSSGGKIVALLVAAALVGGAAGLGGAYAGSQLWQVQAEAPASNGGTLTINNPDSVNQTTAIATKALPSVVTIDVAGGSSGGSGSGVVLTSDGYVVTNTHVVTLDGETSDPAIRVTTSDGRLYDATIVGLDPIYDLAVIKLTDASGLTPMEFADSSTLNVGDQTVAVGAPLGLSNTVTTGIVSALNRSIQISSSAVPDSDGEGDSGGQQEGGPFQFDIPGRESQQSSRGEAISIAVIQTDAAINPGNSGGALVNAEGELIGINVAIASAGQSSGASGSIGVGFSIPSDVVKRVSDEIIADGAATHGLLGASVQSASAVQGASIAGAYVASVTDGGAAAAAGLREGDIVTKFNDVPISDSVDLTAQVRAVAAGSDATVTYVRDGQTRTADVTLGTLQ